MPDQPPCNSYIVVLSSLNQNLYLCFSQTRKDYSSIYYPFSKARTTCEFCSNTSQVLRRAPQIQQPNRKCRPPPSSPSSPPPSALLLPTAVATSTANGSGCQHQPSLQLHLERLQRQHPDHHRHLSRCLLQRPWAVPVSASTIAGGSLRLS